jgi:hypothetical protein
VVYTNSTGISVGTEVVNPARAHDNDFTNLVATMVRHVETKALQIHSLYVVVVIKGTKNLLHSLYVVVLVGPLCGKRETPINDISNTYVHFHSYLLKESH